MLLGKRIVIHKCSHERRTTNIGRNKGDPRDHYDDFITDAKLDHDTELEV